MNNTYFEIERTFYHTACEIHALNLSPEDLKANRTVFNTLATAAYSFFEAVALRSSANARAIALSGCDFYEICNDVTMHYLNKFHRLWETSSPEYYIASVVTLVNRKVLDLVQKDRYHQTVPLEEIELTLTSSCSIEDTLTQTEEINALVSVLADSVNGMDAVYFLARFALNIKPGTLAEDLRSHSPKAVAAAILKTCAYQTSIDISLLEQIAMNVMQDKIILPDSASSTLADYISDRIYEAKRFVKKEAQKTRAAQK